MSITKSDHQPGQPEVIPPIPGGGSWRLVNNQWVPSDAAFAAEPAPAPQPTEE